MENLPTPPELSAELMARFVEMQAANIAFYEANATEAQKALAMAGPNATSRRKAEILVRYVNAALEKKPTMSLPSALEVLRTVFGYDQFRDAQAEIIDHAIGGGDALVLMPTGGGKSLCYQVPAIVRPGTGIVVSPLIALMQDQVDALLLLGVRAAFLNSSLDAAAAAEVVRTLTVCMMARVCACVRVCVCVCACARRAHD